MDPKEGTPVITTAGYPHMGLVVSIAPCFIVINCEGNGSKNYVHTADPKHVRRLSDEEIFMLRREGFSLR